MKKGQKLTVDNLKKYKRLASELFTAGRRLRMAGPTGDLAERERFHAYTCSLKMIEAAREYRKLLEYLTERVKEDDI